MYDILLHFLLLVFYVYRNTRHTIEYL